MKILVIGDTCKDVFVYGKCSRMCPDAPVPVFVPPYTKENRGMAGNVYENLRSFKAVEVDLITNNTEITKTRYVDDLTNHMFVRVDSGEEKIERISNLDSIDFGQYDAVVISDYNKGFLRERDITQISLRHPLTFLDTKKLLGAWAEPVRFIKINHKEYATTEHTLFNYPQLQNKLIITQGSRGCTHGGLNFPVSAVEIKDTTGAGDSFLSALVFRYLHNKHIINDAIEFANECASLVVQQRGVSLVR